MKLTEESKKGEKLINYVKNHPEFKVIAETENWLHVTPLTHNACVLADSYKLGGQGARWCVGYEEDDHFFEEYCERHSGFDLAIRKTPYTERDNELKDAVSWECHFGYVDLTASDENVLKFMIELEENGETSVWSQENERIFDSGTGARQDRLEDFFEITGEDLDKAYDAFSVNFEDY